MGVAKSLRLTADRLAARFPTLGRYWWAVSDARGMTVKALAERIAMHETTLIRNLRILEREGWVELEIGADDRRQRIASLTRKGRAVFGKALVGWQKAQSEVAGVIDEKLPDANRRLVRLSRAVWPG